ncbi:MAG: RNA-binding protein, partial [Lysobacteraceae bacterium]
MCSRKVTGGASSLDAPASTRTSCEGRTRLAGSSITWPSTLMPPVTFLLHKPAGFNSGVGARGEPALACLSPEAHDA